MTHNDFVDEVLARLYPLGTITIDDVRNATFIALHNVKLQEESTEIAEIDPNEHRLQILQRFASCKMIEGLSKKSIGYYGCVLSKMINAIPKPIEQITTDDIRFWMATRMQRDGITKRTADNERRIMSSFFGWAEENDVIAKNPMKKIKVIKQEKLFKKPFSDVEVERLRVSAQSDIRTKAILELLLSTGMRVGELVRLNRDSINGDEAIVYGKGSKERVVYLNARARVAVDMYLETRTDSEEALFVSETKKNGKHSRLGIRGVEETIRELGKTADVTDTHPHRFRRTAATMALERGMPIDQVQQMLGHEQIATTLIYAKSSQESLKRSHQKLMG